MDIFGIAAQEIFNRLISLGLGTLNGIDSRLKHRLEDISICFVSRSREGDRRLNRGGRVGERYWCDWGSHLSLIYLSAL